MMDSKIDSKFMKSAIALAKQSFLEGEIPVGAVIVKDGVIIGKGRNLREKKKNALSHAEIEAINDACTFLNSWRLDGCTMYVTLEPCLMCMGGIINSRIDNLVFGAYDLDNGCADSRINPNLIQKSKKVDIFGGIAEEECSALIKNFFCTVRNDEGPKPKNT